MTPSTPQLESKIVRREFQPAQHVAETWTHRCLKHKDSSDVLQRIIKPPWGL